MPHPCSSVLTVCVIATIVTFGGCESAPQATTRLSVALDHYDAQRFNLAHQHAVEVARSPSASAAEREQAAYLAGLAAFRSGDLIEAELRLNAVSSTSDQRLLASSQALLGQIRMSQRRPAEAAALFDAAARGLDGHDARQAQRYAALARGETSQGTGTGGWADADLIRAPAFSGGFTLQIGAFSERARADQAATQARDFARGHGYGPVAVRQSRDSRGRPLYLVQFGHFPTRQAAAHARDSLGRLDFIVAPLPRS